MRILLVSDQEFLPDRVGGRESSIHGMATRLSRRGHDVTLLCREWQPRRYLYRRRKVGPFWVAATRFRRLFRRFDAEYRILRRRQMDGGYREILDRLAPDVSTLHVHRPYPYLEVARGRNIPQVLFVHDCLNPDWIVEAGTAEEAFYIANSRYIADWCSRLLGSDVPYSYPMIEPSYYTVSGDNIGEYVLFVNPVSGKGLETALVVAGLCPEIPFLFVEGWPLGPEVKLKLKAELSKFSNIRWSDATVDMRTHYKQARILLAPSTWPEAFGRVIVEAQISGIPAIATDIGGIPEAMGEGGILIPPESEPARWAEAIRLLWHDDTEYSLYKEKARSAGRREYLSPEFLTEKLEKLLLATLSSRNQNREQIPR